MTADILEKQKAFFEAGNTWDTRSRRAMLQILANTIKEVAGGDPDVPAVLKEIDEVRKHLYKWSGTGRLRLLLSLFARPKDGPIPKGNILIDTSSADSLGGVLQPLVSVLAAGNTAVIVVPDSPAGETVRRIVDETFTEDFVAVAGTEDAAALREQAFDLVYAPGSSIPFIGQEGFMSFSRTDA